MTSLSCAAKLRDSMSNWDQDLQKIKEPATALHEELTILHDRSKRRLEQFALDPSQDSLMQVQQQLLSEGRQMRELELDHVATRVQKQEACDRATEVLVGKIVGDLINIFGLPAIQRLATELSSPTEDQGRRSRPTNDSNDSSPSHPTGVTAEGLSSRLNGYHTRLAGKKRQMISLPTDPCTAKSNAVGIPSYNFGRYVTELVQVKRKKGANTGLNREKRRCRTAVKQESKAEIKRPDAPASTKPPLTTPKSSYQHDKGQKACIRKTGLTLANRCVVFGARCHTTCVLVYWNPTHHKWVCAMHVSEGQDVPSLDIIVADHLRSHTAAE